MNLACVDVMADPGRLVTDYQAAVTGLELISHPI
jgi:hypothetical protein